MAWPVSQKSVVFALLTIAFVFRAAVGIGVQHHLDRTTGRNFLIAGDAAGYWELGRKLAQGDEYSLYDPPRYAMRMPGFPALLAISMRLAGENFLVARLLLAAVGTAAVGLVFWLGKELFDERTGLIAATLATVSPAMAGFSVLILSETLFAASLVGSLIAMAKLTRVDLATASIWRLAGNALLVGITIAGACYVRPSWLLVAPVFSGFFLCLSKPRRRAAICGGLVLVGALGTLLPWAVRNHGITGHYVFTTLWAGPSLYDGWNPSATGASDMTFFDRDNLPERMSEYEVDRYYRQQAWEFAINNPVRTLELAGIKLLRYWSPWPNAEQFHSLWERAAVTILFVPMLLFALRGWWMTRHRAWCWLLTAGPILYFAAIHMVFVSSLRYRLPAEYPLYVLAAVGLQSWWSGRKSSSTFCLTIEE